MNTKIIILHDDIKNSKTMLAELFYREIPLIALDKKHCFYLEQLTPLIAAPWFLGSQLFVKSQWIKRLQINSVGCKNYDIQPTRNMLITCKYHANIIKSIYEILKEIYLLTNKNYFRDIPTWLGLIISDIITYRIHNICADECLSLEEIKLYHSNIKEQLIENEKELFKKPINSNESHNFKKPNLRVTTYQPLNTFIELTKIYSENLSGFNENYYLPFKAEYQKYLVSLKSLKCWKVTFIDQEGQIYIHRNSGRIGKTKNVCKYNTILSIL